MKGNHQGNGEAGWSESAKKTYVLDIGRREGLPGGWWRRRNFIGTKDKWVRRTSCETDLWLLLKLHFTKTNADGPRRKWFWSKFLSLLMEDVEDFPVHQQFSNSSSASCDPQCCYCRLHRLRSARLFFPILSDTSDK